MNESILLFEKRMRDERKTELERVRSCLTITNIKQNHYRGFYKVLKLVEKCSEHARDCKYADYHTTWSDDARDRARVSVNEYLCRKADKRLREEKQLLYCAVNWESTLAEYKQLVADATE